jgi:predicted RNA-binding protein YlqC (UPF0109 family)
VKDLLAAFVRGLVAWPERVVVHERTLGAVRFLSLAVAPEDRGRVIGRRGRTAAALRTLVGAVAQRRGEECQLEIP